jgi:glycosyltransferase involved in cell wall biosynthesis
MTGGALRILHVVPTYLPATRYGGPIYSVHGLARGLSDLGHDVHVFTTNVDGEKDSDVALGRAIDMDGVKVWYFATGRLRRIYRSAGLGKALTQLVRRFDVAHLHSVFLWPTWAAARACRSSGVPYLIAPRGMMVRDLIQVKSRLVKTTWISLIERSNLEHAAAIHVTADIERQELEKFPFRFPPVITIPNGVAPPPQSVPPALTLAVRQLCERRGPLILYLGRVNWKKNLVELVHAMRHVTRGHLGIVGYDEDDYGKMVADTAASLGLEDRITVLAQPIIGADKEAVLAACDVFVLPSLSENFGNTVLEAAVRGKPIVVSEGAGVATFVRENQCGLVCLPHSDSIGPSIAKVLGDVEGAKALGERARRVALRDYSWSCIARRMSTAYEAAISAQSTCQQPLISPNAV